MTKASDRQIDGTHYKDMGEYQPWDVLKAWLTPEEYRGYQKGVAIAYLARERAKGGDKDIAKATHHLEKLLEVLKEQPAPATPDADGWIRWDGGPYPLHSNEVVTVMLRSGKVLEKRRVRDLSWHHALSMFDITFYRAEANNG